VPPGNPIQLLRIAELCLRRADGPQSARLNKRLSGLGNDRIACLVLRGGNHQCHSPADAMAEKHEPLNAEGTSYPRKERQGLLGDEINRRLLQAPRGFPKAQPVVSDNLATSGTCQCIREITPLINGPQRIVQKDDWRATALIGAPPAYEDGSTRNLEERSRDLSTHWNESWRPIGKLSRRSSLPPNSTILRRLPQRSA
jgi:hypothetical protein